MRGGGSVANGPGALAGTIDMISRADTGLSGEIDGGSRNSLEARGRAGITIGGSLFTLSGRFERGDGFIPITAETRGPADKPAPYAAWSTRGRWVAPIGGSTELQANLSGFHDWRTRGTEFSENRTDGADASLRLVGRGRWQWSALGYWQWRDLMSSFASVSPGRLTASQVSLQDKVPSHGLGGSVELRPPMPRGIELRRRRRRSPHRRRVPRALCLRRRRTNAAAFRGWRDLDRRRIRRGQRRVAANSR